MGLVRYYDIAIGYVIVLIFRYRALNAAGSVICIIDNDKSRPRLGIVIYLHIEGALYAQKSAQLVF